MPRGNVYLNLDEDASVRVKRRQQRRTCFCVVASSLFLALLVVTVVVVLVAVPRRDKSTDSNNELKCTSSEFMRFNCIPEGGKTETKEVCEKRGCCWTRLREGGTSPQCFYPEGFGYKTDGQLVDTPTGMGVNISRKAGQPSQYGGDINTARVEFFYETPYRLRVKFTDPAASRYEVPLPVPQPQSKATRTLYSTAISNETFSFNITRTSKARNIFSTTTGLILSDQFLQLTALLPSHNVYGLGEHAMDHFKLSTNNTVLTLFSRDQPPSPDRPGQNLYGVHPFYLCLEKDGNSHGVFLFNSNAMEIELGPLPSVTYRTIGGILDFYFFLGPSPEAVIQQYTEVVGRPFMPPYWALGFHLCRWGYETANHTREVVETMRAHGIPQDVQWNDIDYMSAHLDFTYNHTSFAELPELVANLHDHGQHYVVITVSACIPFTLTF